MSALPNLPPPMIESLELLLQGDLRKADGTPVGLTRGVVMQEARNILKNADPDARMAWMNVIDNAFSEKEIPHLQESRTRLRAALGITRSIAPASADGDTETPPSYDVIRGILERFSEEKDPEIATKMLCDAIDDVHGQLAVELGITNADVEEFSTWLRASVDGTSAKLPALYIRFAFNTAFATINGTSANATVRWGFDGKSFRRISITPQELSSLPGGPARIEEGYELVMPNAAISSEMEMQMQAATTEGRTERISSVSAVGTLQHIDERQARIFGRAIAHATFVELRHNDLASIEPRVIACMADPTRCLTRLDVSFCNLSEIGEFTIFSLAPMLVQATSIDFHGNNLHRMSLNRLDDLTYYMRRKSKNVDVDLTGNNLESADDERLNVLARNLVYVTGTTGVDTVDEAIAQQRAGM